MALQKPSPCSVGTELTRPETSGSLKKGKKDGRAAGLRREKQGEKNRTVGGRRYITKWQKLSAKNEDLNLLTSSKEQYPRWSKFDGKGFYRKGVAGVYINRLPYWGRREKRGAKKRRGGWRNFQGRLGLTTFRELPLTSLNRGKPTKGTPTGGGKTGPSEGKRSPGGSLSSAMIKTPMMQKPS